MVQIWGHRGCRGKDDPPENSLGAFTKALQKGADGIELDVLLTADDQLVVFHDETLERMTNGQGKLEAYTLAQLKALQLKGTEGNLTDERIPTLDEVLDAVERERSHRMINTEIKQLHGRNSASAIAGVIQKRIHNGWDIGSFQVSSFDVDCLRLMRQTMQQIAIGLLVAGDQAPWDISEQELEKRLDEAADIHPQSVNITLPSMTRGAIDAIKSMNAEPIAWTYNEKNPDEMTGVERRTLVDMLRTSGIAAFITDYPAQFKRMLDVYRAADSIAAAQR